MAGGGRQHVPRSTRLALALLVPPWGLVAAGVADIIEAKLSCWESDVALIRFLPGRGVRSTWRWRSTPGSGPKGEPSLADMRKWINTHTDQVIIIVLPSIGFWLIGKSTYLLVA